MPAPLVLRCIAAATALVLLAGGCSSDDLSSRQDRAQEAVENFEADRGEANGDDAGADPDAASPDPEDRESSAGDPDDPSDAVATAGRSGIGSGTVLVVHRELGDDYGRLAIRNDDGSRTLLDRTCVRVHVAGDVGICLAGQSTDVGGDGFRTELFDPTVASLDTIRSYGTGLPSRARVSPGGAWAASTNFLSGGAYEDIGEGSATIVSFDSPDDAEALLGLNQFEIVGPAFGYAPGDAIYWGPTFIDDSRFYVTGAFGGEPEIMIGDVTMLTVEPTGWIGSCPSLSPDGATLVVKRPRAEGGFGLIAIDVATGEERPLSEDRSVDDQVEWLDDDTILYALHPEGADDEDPEPEFDLWMLDLAEGAAPELFLADANSPTVVR